MEKKDYQEIRELLNSSENPLFLYDDDADGLCSYILLRRYLERGDGVIIKASPELNINFIDFTRNFTPDKIFVLDKPLISQEFVDWANVPVIWIDHHPPIKLKGVKHFNPLLKNPDTYMPTAHICYNITKQNLWIAMVGTISDFSLPKEEFEELYRQYPDLLIQASNPGKIMYGTEFGKLIRIFNFVIKGKASNVKKTAELLFKIKSPYELLNQETEVAKIIYKKYEKVNRHYQELYKEAEKSHDKNLLLFEYPSDKYSFSTDLATELGYRNPEKVVIIARKVDNEKTRSYRISLRSQKHDLPSVIKKALNGLDGYGGGHKKAAGASVAINDFPEFIKRIKKLIQN